MTVIAGDEHLRATRWRSWRGARLAGDGRRKEAASDPNVTRVASRSRRRRARRRGGDESVRLSGEDPGREKRGIARVRRDRPTPTACWVLIERGCAAHLESLETLADAADACPRRNMLHRLESEKEENHASSARSALRAAHDLGGSSCASPGVERNGEIETSDSDTTVGHRARRRDRVPGEDASELTGLEIRGKSHRRPLDSAPVRPAGSADSATRSRVPKRLRNAPRLLRNRSRWRRRRSNPMRGSTGARRGRHRGGGRAPGGLTAGQQSPG